MAGFASSSKWGSFPMTNLINRSQILGVVEPGLVPIRGKRYEQFWDGYTAAYLWSTRPA